MKLRIICSDDDLQEHKLDVDAKLLEWAADQEHFIPALAERYSGLDIQVKKADQLNRPLNFLYQIAKCYQLEFAVHQLSEEGAANEPRSDGLEPTEQEQWEEICYFGYEEGRPDSFEVACYLGL